MYGLVIEGVQYYVKTQYGDETLRKIMQMVKLDSVTFTTHERYSEQIVPNILSAVVVVTGESVEDVGLLAGRYFVQFMIVNGYGELLRVMGRKFSDFLKGMDNLHEYFRFSYPKIKPPSFHTAKENSNSIVLHYRSRRQGYIAYVMGQLIEIARLLYNQFINLQVIKKEEKGSFLFVQIVIRFDNSAIRVDRALHEKSSSLNEYMPVDPEVFLSMFPFFIAFSKDLTIRLVGSQLHQIMTEMVGVRMDEQFDLQRPAVKFTSDGIIAHLNNLFQMESLFPVHKKTKQKAIAFVVNDVVEDNVEMPNQGQQQQDEEHEDETQLPYLVLKGPIIYLKSNDLFIYLPTVVVNSLDDIHAVGLFLQDYGDADCNKEIIMATVQKSDDLKDMLAAEKERSVELALMMKEIDIARKTARDLLTTMLPRQVANELLECGEAKTVCEKYDAVTLAFVKVCDFQALCAKLEAVQVVSLLNTIYSCFDETITRHGVYKVETVGESYMISCGVPVRSEYHAEYIADTALDVVNDIKIVDFPPLGGRGKIQVKVGLNTGTVVGGVVGKRAPRFCLFGDTVNTASRMESHNKMPMSIQCGENTKQSIEALCPGKFKFKHRGIVILKGKGETKTYTIVSKSGRPRYMTNPLIDARQNSSEEIGATMGDGDDPNYTPVEDDGARSTNMSRMSMGSAGGTMSGMCSTRQGSSMTSRASGTGEFAADNAGGNSLGAIGPAVDSSNMNTIGIHGDLEELIRVSQIDFAKRQKATDKRRSDKRQKSLEAGQLAADAAAEEEEAVAATAAAAKPPRPPSGKPKSRPGSRHSLSRRSDSRGSIRLEQINERAEGESVDDDDQRNEDDHAGDHNDHPDDHEDHQDDPHDLDVTEIDCEEIARILGEPEPDSERPSSPLRRDVNGDNHLQAKRSSLRGGQQTSLDLPPATVPTPGIADRPIGSPEIQHRQDAAAQISVKGSPPQSQCGSVEGPGLGLGQLKAPLRGSQQTQADDAVKQQARHILAVQDRVSPTRPVTLGLDRAPAPPLPPIKIGRPAVCDTHKQVIQRLTGPTANAPQSSWADRSTTCTIM